MPILTTQTKWRIYGISPATSHSTHAYYGSYKEVKQHCIFCNTHLFYWDLITFEPWEE